MDERILSHSPLSPRQFLVRDDGHTDENDGHTAYKPITLPYIFFIFIELKFIHFHSSVMFAMKSMSICND